MRQYKCSCHNRNLRSRPAKGRLRIKLYIWNFMLKETVLLESPLYLFSSYIIIKIYKNFNSFLSSFKWNLSILLNQNTRTKWQFFPSLIFLYFEHWISIYYLFFSPERNQQICIDVQHLKKMIWVTKKIQVLEKVFVCIWHVFLIIEFFTGNLLKEPMIFKSTCIFNFLQGFRLSPKWMSQFIFSSFVFIFFQKCVCFHNIIF